jgi:hypothetical protein
MTARRAPIAKIKVLCTAYDDLVEQYIQLKDLPLAHHPSKAESYERIYQLELNHPFWSNAFLLHPLQPWAVDSNVIDGIKFLHLRDRSREELTRLTWEVRRSVGWIDESISLVEARIEHFHHDGDLPAEILAPFFSPDLDLETRWPIIQLLLHEEKSKLIKLALDWRRRGIVQLWYRISQDVEEAPAVFEKLQEYWDDRITDVDHVAALVEGFQMEQEDEGDEEDGEEFEDQEEEGAVSSQSESDDDEGGEDNDQ